MRIYSGLINLDYNPATDILVTSMPSMRSLEMSEVRYCLNLIVETVRNYDIKKVLLDASQSVIEIEVEAYKDISTKFAIDMLSTRLKKLARVNTSDVVREERSAALSADIHKKTGLSIDFRNFSSKTEAMEWLLNS